MATKKPTDWTAIRTEYIEGATASALAEKYGVKIATLKSKASREKWGEERKEVATIVQLETPQKLAGALVDEKVQWVTETAKKLAILQEELFEARKGTQIKVTPTGLATVAFLNDAKDWKAYLEAFAQADKTARQTLGLDVKGSGEQGDGDDGPRPGYVIVPAKQQNWRAIIDERRAGESGSGLGT